MAENHDLIRNITYFFQQTLRRFVTKRQKAEIQNALISKRTALFG